MTANELRKLYSEKLRCKFWSDIDELVEKIAQELEARDLEIERLNYVRKAS